MWGSHWQKHHKHHIISVVLHYDAASLSHAADSGFEELLKPLESGMLSLRFAISIELKLVLFVLFGFFFFIVMCLQKQQARTGN